MSDALLMVYMELRKQGKRQKDLAEAAGVSRSFMSDLLRGNRAISPKVAVAVERVLGIDGSILVREEAERRTHKLYEEFKRLRMEKP